MTLRRVSKSHQNHWTLIFRILCRLRMNWEVAQLLQQELRHSCLIELFFFFEAQFNDTVFYLPYFICIAIKISTVGFFILLSYDAMCANIGIFLFH